MNNDLLDKFWSEGNPGPGTWETALEVHYYNNEIKTNDIPDNLKRYNFVCKIDCSKTSSSWNGTGWYRFTKPAGFKMSETTSKEPR